MAIKLLDDRLVNKIAAGEVVERPASVVKELVENAIDAGSSRIAVFIAGGGIDRIEVVDNGAGIAANDVALAFERHATSKITEEADLLRIHTMGFRGEALPSIASVSRIELYSQCDSGPGIRTFLEGGKLQEIEPYPTAPGTKIIIREIFFNTPVRKKFLKSTVSEGIHIHEIMTKLALSRPDISFSFSNEKKLYFKTPGNGNHPAGTPDVRYRSPLMLHPAGTTGASLRMPLRLLRDVVISIYGQDFATNFLDLEWQGENCALQGLISKPEFRRVNRKNQLFYVNNRFIKSPMLARAVDEGYRGLLLSREYPAVILFLTVASNEVDVNVHPQKTEVRFRDEKNIFRLVSRGIRDRLNKSSVSGSSSLSSRGATLLVSDSEHRWYPEGASEKLVYENYKAPIGIVNEQNLSFTDTDLTAARIELSSLVPTKLTPDTSEYAIIGQCFNSYILVEKDEALWVVDQHAAHERINYSRLQESSNRVASDSQILAFPLAFDLSTAQMDVLEVKLELLQGIGFDIEALGPNTAIIRSAPSLLQGREIEIINEILELLEDERPADLKKEIFAMMACKQSVKAGQSLTRQEMAMIINDLVQVEDYNNCPHGRPTIFRLSHLELDKRFKRK
jgi:DNA mismatch repair protein MutL